LPAPLGKKVLLPQGGKEGKLLAPFAMGDKGYSSEGKNEEGPARVLGGEKEKERGGGKTVFAKKEIYQNGGKRKGKSLTSRP